MACDYPNGKQEENKVSSKVNYEILYHLVSYVDAINHNNFLPVAIDNITISRNDEVIFDNNYYPYNHNELRRIHSITKSVISLLMGIAIEEGCLDNIESSIFNFLPRSKGINDIEWKKKITIKHLLTNTSGIAGTLPVDELPGNLLESVLNQRKINDPGIQFEYSNGSAHLLAMILSNCLKQDLASFAEDRLFQPLGIVNYLWERDKNGIPLGDIGLHLTPLDLNKIGCLCLNKGTYNGKKIVPEEWMEKSTIKQTDMLPLYRTSLGYGYLWWINSFGGYSARGAWGQDMYILPEYKLVVNFNGTGTHFGAFDYHTVNLLTEYIIPSLCIKPTGIKRNYEIMLKEKMKTVGESCNTEEQLITSELIESINNKTFRVKGDARLVFKFDDSGNLKYIINYKGITEEFLLKFDGSYTFYTNTKIILPYCNKENKIAAKGFFEKKDGKNVLIIQFKHLLDAHIIFHHIDYSDSRLEFKITLNSTDDKQALLVLDRFENE